MKKITDILDKIFHYLTALSFGLVSICVLVQVITRYTPGISAPWTDEMTRLFFMYTIMFGAPMAIKYKEYAVIDIVTNSIHGKPRHIISILDYILICIVGGCGYKAGLYILEDRPEDGIHLPEDQYGRFLSGSGGDICPDLHLLRGRNHKRDRDNGEGG